MQPVTWKYGTDSSVAFCGALGSGAGGGVAAAQRRHRECRRAGRTASSRCCDACRARPSACRSCPRCRRSSRRRRAQSRPSGSSNAGRSAQSPVRPISVSQRSARGCARGRAADEARASAPGKRRVAAAAARSARRRRRRSWRRNRSSTYSSSGPVLQALSGTAMAPARIAPKKATGHSGRLRMAMATRSPLATPRVCSSWANTAAARAKASKVARSSS